MPSAFLSSPALPSTCFSVGGQRMAPKRIQSLSPIDVSLMLEILLLVPRNLRRHVSRAPSALGLTVQEPHSIIKALVV